MRKITDQERSFIEARIEELERDNASASGWGAAVGARHEEIKALKSSLAAHLRQSLPEPMGDTLWRRRAEAAELRAAEALRALALILPLAQGYRAIDQAEASRRIATAVDVIERSK